MKKRMTRTPVTAKPPGIDLGALQAELEKAKKQHYADLKAQERAEAATAASATRMLEIIAALRAASKAVVG